jgi:hypothetical protein
MSIDEPFTGTLYLPDKVVPSGTSPVMLADGRTIAQVRWHFWTVRHRFEVLDPAGTELAEGGGRGLALRRYVVRRPDGHPLVELRLGLWRPINGSTVTLASGRLVSVRKSSVWSDRRFEILTNGRPAGRIRPTTGVFTFHPDSYELELTVPVLSILEAICLAQALRTVIRSRREQAASASH